MRYQAIIWDLDGTLLNTIDDLRDATNRTLQQYGYPPRTIEEMKHFVGNGIRVMLARATPGGEDNPHFADMLRTFTEDYDAHCRVKTAPYPGIPEVLARIREAGISTAVVTNKIQAAADSLISELFPAVNIVIGDSPDVRRKPAPDGVWKALRLLGVKPENAAYVGDSNVDFETAKNAGLPCLSVLWGFRTREELLACGADCFFETPSDLLAYLLA